MLRRSSLAFVLVATVSCFSPPSDVAPRPTPTPTPTPLTLAAASKFTVGLSTQRPGQPALASAAWGEQVAASFANEVVAGAADSATSLQESLSALGSLAPGSEARAYPLAVRSWQQATDDVGHGTALAVMALALVLDPREDGVVERLVDATGLGIYAGTVDNTDAIARCARALVASAAGQGLQAAALVKMVAETPQLSDDERGWLAIARDGLHDGSDAFFADAARGLAARPDNIRLLHLVATHLLELGFADEALTHLGQHTEAPLLLLRGRALVETDQAAAAVALLEPLAAQLQDIDEPHRAEVLFWLGCARLSLVDLDAAQLASVDELVSKLEARSGWNKAAVLLRALRLGREAKEGFVVELRSLLLPFALGPPTSTLVVERKVVAELLKACGLAKDLECVKKAARRMMLLDVDTALIEEQVFAAGPGADTDAAAAPTDEGLRIASADLATQRKLLALRRAIAARAPLMAEPLVTALLKDPELRVARALRVKMTTDPALMARLAAAALTGLGPALGEADLVNVVAGLGASKTKDSEALLSLMDKDPRPTVQAAAIMARQDLKDPASRLRRIRGVVVENEDGPEGMAP